MYCCTLNIIEIVNYRLQKFMLIIQIINMTLNPDVMLIIWHWIRNSMSELTILCSEFWYWILIQKFNVKIPNGWVMNGGINLPPAKLNRSEWRNKLRKLNIMCSFVLHFLFNLEISSFPCSQRLSQNSSLFFETRVWKIHRLFLFGVWRWP